MIRADPDVQGVGAFVGGRLLNEGQIYISLKPRAARRATSGEVADRLRLRLSHIVGLKTYLSPVQELSSNVRRSKSQFQFTLSGPSLTELEELARQVTEALSAKPGLVDVNTDHEMGGLRARLAIDRKAAGRTGVSVAAIDAALGSAFGQRQDSIIYTPRNQYRVVFEGRRAGPARYRRSLRLYVGGADGALAPLSTLAHVETGARRRSSIIKGCFPRSPLSYNLAPGARIESAGEAVEKTVAHIGLPAGAHADFAGEAADFRKIVGVPAAVDPRRGGGGLCQSRHALRKLRASRHHPVDIAVGGAGRIAGVEARRLRIHRHFTLIGLLLLIGIVKKNGIILVDFAQHVRRTQGVPALDAASTQRRSACGRS